MNHAFRETNISIDLVYTYLMTGLSRVPLWSLATLYSCTTLSMKTTQVKNTQDFVHSLYMDTRMSPCSMSGNEMLFVVPHAREPGKWFTVWQGNCNSHCTATIFYYFGDLKHFFLHNLRFLGGSSLIQVTKPKRPNLEMFCFTMRDISAYKVINCVSLLLHT